MARVNATCEQRSSIAIETRYGRFYIPDRSDLIANSLREYGEWAQAELDILCQFMAYGDTIIDGGACYGTHARAFSEKVGARGRVICFEPSPANRAVLAQNATGTELHNIDIRAGALAEQRGRGRLLETPEGNAGGTRLVADANDGPVALVRLDDEIDEAVQFIKLDLEGGELAALKGAARILAEHRPVVFSEVLGIGSGVDLLRLMQGQDYFCCGTNTPAFNPKNFNGSVQDIFADGRECGLLFLPTEYAARFSERIEALALPLIETPDDLVLLLLQQPQYCRETLRRQIAARRLQVPPPLCDIVRTERERRAQLDQLSARAEDLVSALAQRSNERDGLAAELVESRTALEARTAEAEALTQKLAESRADVDAAVGDYTRRFDDARVRLDELHTLHEQWRVQNLAAVRLARRVRKFPLALYFRVNRRYRRSTRNLLRSADMPDLAKARLAQLRELFSATLPQPAPDQSGYRAEVLRAITSTNGQAVLAPPPEIHEPVLEAEAIATTLAHYSEQVVVSLSQDNYQKVPGGTQVCIQIEADRAAAACMNYLNIHPVRTCTGLLPESETDTAVFRLVLNGAVLGVARYADIVVAIESRRVLGQSFQFVVHHLLGHAPEAVAQMIEVGGDSRCCFWLHDFFAACQSYTLTRNNVSYCGGPDAGSPACGVCVFGQARTRHMQRFREFFDQIAVTALAPSNVAAEIWTKACDYRLHELIVQPHITLETAPRPKPLPVFGREDDAPIRVAYVGAPVAHKGWLEFERLVADHAYAKGIEFHYFGSHEVALDIIKHHVKVSVETLDAMTRALAGAGIDLVLHFARWPETFSLTTAEALASYAFVVTQSQSGNVAALVQATGRGVVMESEDALSAWLSSTDCRNLVRQARERRRNEVLHARYSDMAIPAVQSMSAQ